MSENTLVTKIEADAQAAVAEVQAKQAAAIERLEAEAQVKITELRKEHEKHLEKHLAHIELVALSRAKQAANIAVQKAKREAIDEIFESVRNDLASLEGDAYIEFYSAIVKSIMPAEIKISAIHAPGSRLAETEKILKASNLDAEVTADKSVSAGLIIHTKTGVYDATLDRLFADNKAKMEMEVVAALSS